MAFQFTEFIRQNLALKTCFALILLYLVITPLSHRHPLDTVNNLLTAMLLYRIALYTIIAFNALILADSFLLPQVKQQEVYKTSSFIRGFDRGNRPYTLEFLIMQSGHRYLLPVHGSAPLKENDSVVVGLTRLFRRPASITWHDEETNNKADLRILNNGAALVAGPIASMLFPFLILLTPSRLNNKQRGFWLIVSIALTAMNVWFYWW